MVSVWFGVVSIGFHCIRDLAGNPGASSTAEVLPFTKSRLQLLLIRVHILGLLRDPVSYPAEFDPQIN